MTARTTVELVSKSVEQTWSLGAAVGRACRPGDVVLLKGELGAGKTQFVRGLAQGMGIDPTLVSSPTFVLMSEYEAQPANGGALLVHIDAYRLRSADELSDTGFTPELRAQAVTAIEWAGRVQGLVDADDRVLEVRLSHGDNDRRTIELQGRAALIAIVRRGPA